MTEFKNDAERVEWLHQLDDRDVDVTEWEADFLASVIGRGLTNFTDKQRDVIGHMFQKYGY